MSKNLIGEDITLLRNFYDEALEMQGIPCTYQYPIMTDTNAQGESVIDHYSLPTNTHIFFEGSPRVKTFKRYGWVVENDNELPFLIRCSFNLEHLQRDSLFVIAGQYTGLPERTFKVTEISYDLQAPDHLACQVIPVYENQAVGRTKEEISRTFNKSENFIKNPVDYRGEYITDTTKYRRRGKPTHYLGRVVGNVNPKNMFKIDNDDIELTRGDSATIKVEITKQDNSLYKRKGVDKLVFTLKKSYNSNQTLLRKEIEGLTFLINPEDTQSLAYGEYWYDIQLTTTNGNVYTVVGPARFILREEVTF